MRLNFDMDRFILNDKLELFMLKSSSFSYLKLRIFLTWNLSRTYCATYFHVIGTRTIPLNNCYRTTRIEQKFLASDTSARSSLGGGGGGGEGWRGWSWTGSRSCRKHSTLIGSYAIWTKVFYPIRLLFQAYYLSFYFLFASEWNLGANYAQIMAISS